ncbi:MAG TPA: hypothetical protein DGM69_04870 [Chloroflexi bacterium]|nr:hypothetical protein [Chloroflexota bacterium]|tara:strand:+ start:110 stop:778 length:669 start_codon:yes stop_codon:yes gene_type:complete
MKDIFQTLKECEENLLNQLSSTGAPVPDHHEWPWRNYVFESVFYRRAHLDAVETDKLYMFHLCIFPRIFNPAPIYGVDVIAGKNIVGGAFHDFSKAGDEEHYMMKWFQNKVKPYKWTKTRELPEWAQNIFSPGMVAVSRTKEPQDYVNFCELAVENLEYYLTELEISHNTSFETSDKDYIEEQNWYCKNQKLNPHTPKVMRNFCEDDETVRKFIHECLFPEI